MDSTKLKKNLEYIVNEYIEDIDLKKELQMHIDNLNAKFILGEIERRKTKNYSVLDKELVKDIYFYYC